MEVRAPIDEACFAAAIAPDNSEITATFGERSTRNAGQNPVIVYALPSGQELRRIDFGHVRTNDAAYSPDGADLYLGREGTAYTGAASYLRIGRHGDSEAIPVVSGLNWGDDVIFSPCGRWIVFQGELGEPVVVDRSTGEARYRIARADAFSIDFSPDGERFAAVNNTQMRLTVYRSDDGRVRILHGAEREPAEPN